MSKISEFNNDSLRKIAREVVTRRLALSIHGLAYLFMNILLGLINWLVDYSYRWHYWVITAWGLGLIIHGCVYMFWKKGVEKVSMLVMYYHIVLYVLVNSFLLFTDWFTNPGDGIFYGWVYYPLVFWGLGLFAHIVIYLALRPKDGADLPKKPASWVDRKVDEELAKIQKK